MNSHTSGDTITLRHGDGGGATIEFVKSEILSRFGNPVLNSLEDGALVEIDHSSMVVTTDSFIVDPPVFSGGDIGKLAITGTINDLVACGARPRYCTMGLVLYEGTSLAIVRRVLESARRAAAASGVTIIAGDTKVMPRSEHTGCIINTTGIGAPLFADRGFSVAAALPDDTIIVTGPVGAHSIAVLSKREGLGFCSRISSDCAALDSLILPLLSRFAGIRSLRDPTRGGLLGVLFDIAEGSAAEVHFNRAAVPVQKEVAFACEMLGLDPLTLANEGCMVIAADAAQAPAILTALRRSPLGRRAAAIGNIRRPNRGQAGRVYTIDGGKKAVLLRPEGQAIPRLC
jgi:hydrogenase expression/formation protein HypE